MIRALGGRWWMVVWLTTVWVALWGELTLGNVVAGALLSGAVLVAFAPLTPGRLGVVRPLRLLRLAAYFLWQLVLANLTVAWLVLRPRGTVHEAVVGIRVSGASDAILTAIANAITLTPGTLTLDVRRDPATLYVHVLHLRSVEDTRRGVRELERHVVEAVGDAEAVAAMAQRHDDAERDEEA
ncbi:MAG TPA: Na+/H+ antiporter subunit E [Egibacteraceae bacterium]